LVDGHEVLANIRRRGGDPALQGLTTSLEFAKDLLVNNIAVFRVTPDPASYERARRNDESTPGSQVIQRFANENRTDAGSLVRFFDLGVHEPKVVVALLVENETCDLVVYDQLVPVLLRIVSH
jgi:hypothetical protein